MLYFADKYSILLTNVLFFLFLCTVELESFLIEITSTILRRKDDLPPAEGESECDGDEERCTDDVIFLTSRIDASSCVM
jgi:hypothetical protein